MTFPTVELNSQSTDCKQRLPLIVSMIVGALVATPDLNSLSAAPMPPDEDTIPGSVFCCRITDIDRVDLDDGTPKDDFVIMQEYLNWTTEPVDGIQVRTNVGTGFGVVREDPPDIVGLGIDRDGRGGPIGGQEIDAGGRGDTTGQGTADDPAIHSGFGRTGALNNWTPDRSDGRVDYRAERSDAASIPNRDLLGTTEPARLVPSRTAPYEPGDEDALGDSAVDGGPGTFAPGDTGGDIDVGNVMDGFTMTVQDFDEGEVLSINWAMLTGRTSSGEIPSVVTQNGERHPFGFGTWSIARGNDSLPTFSVFTTSSGFSATNSNFAMAPDGNLVNQTPNPAIFASEVELAQTARFLDPSDNTLDLPVTTRRVDATSVPTPNTLVLFTFAIFAVVCANLYARNGKRRADDQSGRALP